MPGRVAMGSSSAIWYAVPTGARQGGTVVSKTSLDVPRSLACISEDIETASGSCAAQNSYFFDLLTQLPSSLVSSSIATVGFTGNDTPQPDSIWQPKTSPSNMESPWDHDDTQLADAPTYIISSSTQQSLAVGTPQSRAPAAATLTCPPAPVRPRPSMILVPAEELHLYTSTECPPTFCGAITSWCM